MKSDSFQVGFFRLIHGKLLRLAKSTFHICVSSVFVLMFSSLIHAQPHPNCGDTCGGGTQPKGTGGGPIQGAASVSNQRGTGSARAASDRAGKSINIEGSQSFTYPVPLFDISGRGVNLNLAAYYNSLVWVYNGDNNSMAYAANWQVSPGFTLGYGYVAFSTTGTVGMLIEPNGAVHLLVVNGAQPNYHTTDSSYIQVVAPSGGPVTATFKDGMRVLYQAFTVLANNTTEYRPYQVEDTNGNFISITYADANDLNINTITDTVGRVIKFTYDSTGKMLQSVALLDGNGNVFRQYTFTWALNQTLTFNFTLSATAGLGLNPGVYTSGQTQLNYLTKITRPDGTAVAFDYVNDGTTNGNPDWGIVKTITELSSTGAARVTTSYLFSRASAGALTTNPTYTQQTVNDTVNTKTWTYQATKSGSLVTSFAKTDPCGNVMTTTFSAAGDALDGLPIKETLANTQSPPSGCPTNATQTWRTVNKAWTTDTDGSNARVQSVSTVLEDGSTQSEVSVNSYDSFGQPTDVLEYGLGTNAAGPLLRETLTAYASPGSGIVNRPSRITIKDSSGNIIGRTDFGYDEVSVTDISPNPVGHDSAFTSSTTVRGNLTSTTSYANASAGTGGVTSNFTYDAAGNQLTSKNGCCTYSEQSFSSTTNYSLPDSVTTGPAQNSLSLTSSFTYNLLTGTVATSTDPNNQKTSYSYDIDNRLTQTTLPDTSTISQSYDDSSASPSTTVSNSFNSLVKTTTVAGPTVTDVTKNGASVVSSKTVTSDLMGRAVSVSNPFAPGDTALYTTYTYDPLGRVTQLTPPGNTGSYTTSYGIQSTSIDAPGHMVLTVTSTDPAGKQRKRYSDGLGLRQVDEPGTSGGQAGAGSASIAGTEQSASVQNGGGATAGTGSVTISGSERSTSVLTHNATAATATVTVSGSDIFVVIDPCSDQGLPNPCPRTVWDFGTVSVTINGITKSASYGQNTQPADLATALATGFGNNGTFAVSASGATLTVTADTAGTAGNSITLSVSSCTTSGDLYDFGGSGSCPGNPPAGDYSFALSPSGSTLSGGTDNGFTTMYDTGTVNVGVTISGTVYSKSSAYSQTTTAAGIATDLANQINSDTTLNKLLIANASSGTLSLTTTASGNSTNYPLSVGSATNSQYFSSGSTSFPATASGSTLTPGQNGTIYDTGTVTVSITGFTTTPYSKTVNYSQGSTPSSIASSLAGAFNSDQFSPVSASASAGTLNLTASAPGADTNYGVAVTSATTQPAQFSQASFSGSSVALSGGQDPTASLNTPLSTSYSYDPLGRLLQVNQGAQQRVYQYDNLGRLTSSAIPETKNQATTFTYTDQGLNTKTDPRGIVTTYGYDALSRVNQVSYSDSTATVTYTYGAAGASNFGAGRLIKVVDASGTTTFQFDLMGRSTQVSRAIGTQTYTTSYSYTNEQLDTMTYPSGRTVKMTPDAIGRLSAISSNGSSLLNITSYNAAGEILGASYGNGMTANYQYNSQLQLATLVSGSTTTPVLNLSYSYGAQDSGQIQSISDGITASQSTSYTYDELGRLKIAQTNDLTSPNTWKLKFTYDRYGNRLSEIPVGGTATMPFNEVSVDAASNRINSLQYDAAGNVTNDGLHTYSFNAENKITQVDGAGSFVYDAAGRRVIKNGTVYIYEDGQVIAEYPGGAAPGSPSVEYVGQLASFTGGASTYYFHDHLSIDALANVSGSVAGRQARFPLGEIMAALQSGTVTKWQFTTYEGDRATGESGLDYAQARFYSSRLGRFTSLDPFSGSTADPQSLNRYVYAANDPINLVDPTGMLHGRLTCLLDTFGNCVGGNGYNPGGGYGGWGWDSVSNPLTGGCTLDGLFADCGVVSAVLQMDAGTICPNNSCHDKNGFPIIFGADNLFYHWEWADITVGGVVYHGTPKLVLDLKQALPDYYVVGASLYIWSPNVVYVPKSHTFYTTILAVGTPGLNIYANGGKIQDRKVDPDQFVVGRGGSACVHDVVGGCVTVSPVNGEYKFALEGGVGTPGAGAMIGVTYTVNDTWNFIKAYINDLGKGFDGPYPPR